MVAGDSYTDPAGGVTFKVDSMDATKAVVTVTLSNGSGSSTCMDGTTLQGSGPETCSASGSGGADPDHSDTPPEESPPTPAGARLGSAGLARLRARHAELLTRIVDRVEPERQEELKALAERLNPDAWITDADVTAGLDAYEQTYEMVRSSLPPRRKPGEPV